MHDEEFAIYVTHMPSLPAINWHAQAVLVVESCIEFGQLAILIRHDGGRAHFGPVEACGPPSDHDLLRGELLRTLLHDEMQEAINSRVIRAIPLSTLN